ncbi:hypothetical protein D9M68_660250 [compost metagenome]
MESTAVGEVHFDLPQGLAHAHLQFDHRACGVGLAFIGVVVPGATLDLADPRQWTLDRVFVGVVDGQVETHPGLAILLETLDVAGAEGCSLGAGVELGCDFQVEVLQLGVFVEAVHGLLGGEAKAGEGEQAGNRGEGLECHKSFGRNAVIGPGARPTAILAEAPGLGV